MQTPTCPKSLLRYRMCPSSQKFTSRPFPTNSTLPSTHMQQQPRSGFYHHASVSPSRISSQCNHIKRKEGKKKCFCLSFLPLSQLCLKFMLCVVSQILFFIAKQYMNILQFIYPFPNDGLLILCVKLLWTFLCQSGHMVYFSWSNTYKLICYTIT